MKISLIWGWKIFRVSTIFLNTDHVNKTVSVNHDNEARGVLG